MIHHCPYFKIRQPSLLLAPFKSFQKYAVGNGLKISATLPNDFGDLYQRVGQGKMDFGRTGQPSFLPNRFVLFLKVYHRGLFYCLFSVFSKNHYNFLQQHTCRDSSPRPLVRESPSITTRPCLLSLAIFCSIKSSNKAQLGLHFTTQSAF